MDLRLHYATPKPERHSSSKEYEMDSWRSPGSVWEYSSVSKGPGDATGASSDIVSESFSSVVNSAVEKVEFPWESSSQQKDLVFFSTAFAPPAGCNQSLSRTSSGSAQGSIMGSPVVGSTVGSPANSREVQVSMNFHQAEEDFQLQLALALRLTAEAAAVDDPDFGCVRGLVGSSKMMPGATKIEATAYRYWASNSLSYDDQIEDGFYEVWGMSPYIWSMCTDSNELGRMPPLDSLRNVLPSDAGLEVVLVDRNIDPGLRELEDKAVSLAYDSTEVLDMASKLSIMVANVMGGPANSDEDLREAWQAAGSKVMQRTSSIVLPIGVLKIGLARHRALLFKVMCDSVGLPCRIVRGHLNSGKGDDAMCVVKCGNDREWIVDLLGKPGNIMPLDAQLTPPPAVIASPLQFERHGPFGGSNIAVHDWARSEFGSKDHGNKNRDDKHTNVKVDSVSYLTGIQGSESSAVAQGLEFVMSENLRKPESITGVSDDIHGLVTILDAQKQNNYQVQSSQMELSAPRKDSKAKLKSSGNSSSGDERQGVDNTGGVVGQAWAKEERRSSGGSNEFSFNKLGRAKMLDLLSTQHNDYEIDWDDIVVGERIGQGSYGKVYRADWQGSDVAVKVFLDQDLKVEALEEFKAEVAIMLRLRHPNIVLFMGAVTKPPNLSIITEFCPRGSLYRLLHRPNRELDDRRRIRMALDVVKGMNYLHRCSPPVVHRDLKSPNLLVDKNWTVKVCDFGLSRQKHSTFLSSKSSAGTPEWMAPEVLRNEPSDEKSDVYSFGVILWELSTLQVPWNGMSPIQVVGAVGFQHRRLLIPNTVDSAVAAIIQACWRTDSKLRPSFADLMLELRNLQRTNSIPVATSPTE